MASDPLDHRTDYTAATLEETSVAADPIVQLDRWIDEAWSGGAPEANSMAVATVSPAGRPSQRNVLLRGLDAAGLVFYTSYRSAKARDLEANPRASALFSWLGLQRQVRVEGVVGRVEESLSDAYFASRPRDSRIGAWASEQSSVIASRDVLEHAVAEAAERFAGGDVPRPSTWGGFRLVPDRFEFWQGRSSRLHDRIVYLRDGDAWRIERLAP